MINYDNKRFRSVENTSNGETSSETIFIYKQEGNILTSEYSGGEIAIGHLIGLVDSQSNIEMSYHQINVRGGMMTGTCKSKPEVLPSGKIQLHEIWEWTSGDKSKGSSVLDEV